jgi:hypothetical protein
MEAAASEVGLQQQLEELEGLVLARGLLGPAAAGARCVNGGVGGGVLVVVVVLCWWWCVGW